MKQKQHGIWLAMLALGFGTSALAQSTAPTQVFFQNIYNTPQPVDVYIDGALVFNDVFSGTSVMYPRAVSPGARTVVVTPWYLPLGQGDLLRTTLTVGGSTSTLKLQNADAPTSEPRLTLSQGQPK
ncbi:hypothetical protein ACFFLM_08100 [Deinococcus oregonensis]|uniref:DUF4397 domain-containing protein n=1 Tax=Deinococcus oregonensis TaxID=1805970 RepID=A0ABV6AWP4_9DEIO